MKKGFTMIELIFVIVILGILAAVAIPRLAATRDDAEVSKAATNISTLISDISSYYTSQGEFGDSLNKMTNVALSGVTGSLTAGSEQTGNIKVAGEDCFLVTVTPKPTVAVGALNVDIISVANVAGAKKNACKAAQSDPQIVKFVTAVFDTTKCKKMDTTNTGCEEWEPAKGIEGFPLTGLSVVK